MLTLNWGTEYNSVSDTERQAVEKSAILAEIEYANRNVILEVIRDDETNEIRIGFLDTDTDEYIPQ